MYFINKLCENFYNDYEVVKQEETFEEVFIEIVPKSNLRVENFNISGLRDLIPFRDKLSIDFDFNGDIESIELDLIESQEDLKKIVQAYELDFDNLTVKYRILKSKNLSLCTIYSISIFSKYLNELSLLEVIYKFDRIFNEFKYITLYTPFNANLNVTGNSLSFSDTDVSHSKPNESIKSSIIKKRNSVCHINSTNSFNLIPDDFKLDGKLPFVELNSLFDKLRFVLSITMISNSTSLTNERIFGSIIGYKSLIFDIKYSELAEINNNVLTEIYDWIYSEGNVIDKSGLARNIVSLNSDANGLFSIPKSIIGSIKSGYDIYLKENVTRYLEVKNKIDDGLIDLAREQKKISQDFINNFQKGIFSYLSFFISLVAIRLLTKPDFTEILPREPALLAFLVLFIMVVFLCYSLWEITNEQKRMGEEYNNIKKRYSDILVLSDIERILNHHVDEQSFHDYINGKKLAYLIASLIILILFSISIFVISDL